MYTQITVPVQGANVVHDTTPPIETLPVAGEDAERSRSLFWTTQIDYIAQHFPATRLSLLAEWNATNTLTPYARLQLWAASRRTRRLLKQEARHFKRLTSQLDLL